MRQIIQNYNTGELQIEEVPVPLLQEGGAIVRTCFSLISAGTERSTLDISKKSIVGKARARPDLVKKVIATSKKIGVKNTIELVRNRLNAPVPLGYSLTGIVEEVSDGIVGINVGDRVACAGVGYANHAERVFVPQNLMAKIPEAVSDRDAAFTTVGSIALHGVRQANVGVGDAVGVIGLGLVGQLTVALLKAQGCRVIGIDLNEYAVNLSKKMGIDEAVLRKAPFLGEAIQQLSGSFGLDAVLITAGTDSNDPFELASELLRDKGTLVVVGGIRMEIVKSVSSLFYLKEIDIRFSRSYGPGRYDPNYEEKGLDYPIGFVRWTEKRNMECFLGLLASGGLDLSPLITHTFPFEKAIEAYSLITGKTREPYLGVLLQYEANRKPEPSRITLSQKTTPLPGQIGIGMIGAGSFAQSNILPHLKENPNVALRGLFTSKGMTAKSVSGKFGFSYCASNSEEIINDNDSQVVFIATRHDSHAKYVIESLEKAKHVYVEKPLCLNEEELGQIVDLLKSRNLKEPSTDNTNEPTNQSTNQPILMVGYNRRFAPLSLKLKAFLGEIKGPITIIYRVNAGYIPPDNWYQDPSQGGRFVGEGCHFVDYGQFLTDSRPARVFSAGIPGKGKPLALTDNLVVTVEMEDGSVLTIIYNSSGDTSMPKERVEVFGQSASAVLDDFKSLQIFHSGKRKIFKRLSQDKGYKNEIEAFVHALKMGGDPPIRFENLAATSLATFAAIESLKKKTSVEIEGS